MKNIATTSEVINYKAVEKAIENYTMDEFSEFLDKVSEFAFTMGKERKAAYNKLRSVAKKLGVTVLALEDWFFVDAAM